MKKAGLNQVKSCWDHLYIGGSLTSFILSHNRLDCLKDIERLDVSDIDLYTTNYIKTIQAFHALGKIKVNRRGVVIDFTLANDIKIQVITAEISDFEQDVLEHYDCDLVERVII